MRAIFLDTETGGLDPSKHPLLEIAFVVVDLISNQTLQTFCSLVKPDELDWTLCDPAALKINGFKQHEFNQAPSIKEVGDQILNSFETLNIHRKNAVFICQNPSFDRAFFSKLIHPHIQEAHQWPYHWLDLASMYWAIKLKEGKKPWDNGLSKDKIALDLKLPCEKAPHRALRGVEHLKLCFDKLFSS
jgi:DNA polymerase-3 subunit epsilon/oligoribonuclease